MRAMTRRAVPGSDGPVDVGHRIFLVVALIAEVGAFRRQRELDACPALLCGSPRIHMPRSGRARTCCLPAWRDNPWLRSSGPCAGYAVPAKSAADMARTDNMPNFAANFPVILNTPF